MRRRVPKREILALVAVLAFSMPDRMAAGTAPAGGGGPVPRLSCPEPDFDFGRVLGTGTITHAFALANVGDAPLRIERVRASCGCTVAKAASDVVPPGGTTEVTVVFALAGRSGRERKSIYVHSNDPATPIFRLELGGLVVAASSSTEPVMDRRVRVSFGDGTVKVRPERLDLGRVRGDCEVEGDIELVGDQEPFKVTGVASDSTNVTAELIPGRAGRQRVIVRLRPPPKAGHGEATVVVQTTHASMGRVAVPVVWEAMGDLYVVPEELAFVASPGRTNAVSRVLAVRSRDGRPFAIKGVRVPVEGMVTKVSPIGDGRGYYVTLSGIVPSASLDGQVVGIATDEGAPINVRLSVRRMGEGLDRSMGSATQAK